MELNGSTHLGPVPATLFANRTADVLRAVREGETIPVSTRGEVVAVIRPITHREAVLAGYLDDPDIAVSARALERTGPSALLRDVADGAMRVITYWNRPFAIATPVSMWTELDDVLAATPEPTIHVPDDAHYA